MLRPLSMLAVAAVLGTGGTAAAAGASHTLHVHAPKAPSITAKTVPAPKAPAGAGRLAALKVNTPTVAAPKVAHPDLTPVNCTSSSCSTSDPARLAGTVVSFNGTTLTETTTSGHTYTATLNSGTTVACPSQRALDNGHVFNPVTPSITTPGSGQASAPPKPQIKDQYACSTTNITVGRHIAGAELGRDASGQMYWIAIALAPR